MTTLVNPGHLTESSSETKDAIKVLIVYEDFATGQHAMSASKRLFGELTRDFESQASFWKFDVLRVPTMRQLAAQDAIEADVVVIAAHAGQALPADLKSWLQSCLDQKAPGVTTLVAMLGVGGQTANCGSQAHCYLKEVAQKRGLHLLIQTFPLPESQIEPTSESIRGDVVVASSVLEDMLPPTAAGSRWGINE